MLELVAAALPAIAPSSPDHPLVPSILAGPAEGWSGVPALVAHRVGAGPARLPLRIRRTAVTQPDAQSVSIKLLVHDDHGPLLTVDWQARLSPDGVVVIALDARGEAPEGVDLHRLAATAVVVGLATTLLSSPCWARLALAFAPARCGRCTTLGAAIARPASNLCPPATAVSLPPSCLTLLRWCSPRASVTPRPRQCWPGRTRASTASLTACTLSCAP